MTGAAGTVWMLTKRCAGRLGTALAAAEELSFLSAASNAEACGISEEGERKAMENGQHSMSVHSKSCCE